MTSEKKYDFSSKVKLPPTHHGTDSLSEYPKKLVNPTSTCSVLRNRDDKENKIVIPENILSQLFSNLSLGEVETVTVEDTVLGKEEKSENYFEACGDPEELKQLCPWTSDGPILRTLPEFFEMFQMVKEGHCTCLFLGCQEEVLTKKIKKASMSPWYFMCLKHQMAVTERYGYGPKKII